MQSGLYYWAGPGTIRMIKLKFPGAKIDEASLLESYEPHILKRAKKTLGITDAFVTFSWGFNSNTEAEDYAFIRDKLPNFKKQGIAAHAYVQGMNLVKSDHQEDFWARDLHGRLLPYHRGRKITCPNNPLFRQYLGDKVQRALKEDFAGVFVDNFHFGQIPIRLGNRFSFFGCACRYCQKRYRLETGKSLPHKFVRGSQELEEYLAFRARVMGEILKELSAMAHKAGKKFGTNSFDGKLDSRIYLGPDRADVAKYQDYLLFENHDLPRKNRSNLYLREIIQKSAKPVLVVSYRKGIGRERQWPQKVFDRINSEAKLLGYVPCYKGTEYRTSGIWHNLRLQTLDRPIQVPLEFKHFNFRDGLGFGRGLRLVEWLYAPFMNWLFENRWGQRLGAPLYYWALRN